MPDRSDSHRPQDRDFNVDDWEKFPFKSTKEDPYENRSEERKDDSQQSQYKYEGWEHEAFPNKDVSETHAEPSEAREKGVRPPASSPSPNKPKES